jgi:hypothetical protein
MAVLVHLFVKNKFESWNETKIDELIDNIELLYNHPDIESVVYTMSIPSLDFDEKRYYVGHTFVVHFQKNKKYRIYQSYLNHYSLDYFIENLDGDKEMDLDEVLEFVDTFKQLLLETRWTNRTCKLHNRLFHVRENHLIGVDLYDTENDCSKLMSGFVYNVHTNKIEK